MITPLEVVYRLLGKFFYKLWAFFSVRAGAMQEKRMTARYQGREVRVTCDCDTCLPRRQGTWLVDRYDADAGDLRLVREILGRDEVAYVPTADVQIVEP